MSDREMNIAAPDKQMPRCGKCGLGKVQIDNAKECPNCYYDNQPKTGQTMVVHEGPNGGIKIEYVKPGDTPSPPPASPAASAQPTPCMSQGTISVNVPVELFPELVMWARKLKLPKNWAEANKLKAIVDFQVHLNNKLQELTK